MKDNKRVWRRAFISLTFELEKKPQRKLWHIWNPSRNVACKSLWDAAKILLRGKCMSIYKDILK